MAEPTLETLNKERERLGLPLMEKLPTKRTATATSTTTKEKGVEENPPLMEVTPPTAPKELDDNDVLAYLTKKGITVEKLEDLTKSIVAPDPVAEAEKRENEKLKFGLEKGFFNSKTYQSFLTESKDPTSVVWANYYNEAKKDDPDLSDEDIRAEFEEKYGLTSEAGTRKHKRGQQEISLLSDNILKNKYAKIYQIDGEFEKFENSEKSKAERNKKIISQSPAYKKDVEEIFSELQKFNTKLKDEDYSVEVPAEILTAAKNYFLDSKYAAQKIEEGWTKEQIKEIAETTLIRAGFGALAEAIAVQYAYKHQAGVRGIVPMGAQLKGELKKELTAEQQQMVDVYKNSVATPAPAAN